MNGVAVRLRYAVRNVAERGHADPRPHVTLEDLESKSGRLRGDYVADPRPGDRGVNSFSLGDVLFGKLRPYLEKSALCGRDGYCSPELLVLRPLPGITSRYLAYLVRSAAFVAWANETSDGVKMPRTSWEDLADFRFVLPGEAVQAETADRLDAELRRIDEVVGQKLKLQDLLLERRRSVVAAGVSGDLDKSRAKKASSIPWLPQIPSGWGSARLKYVAKLGTGHTPSRQHPEWWQDCVIPWITTGDVFKLRDDRLEILEDTEERISQLGLENSSAVLHQIGTVVLCRTAASAGYSAIMGREMATSQDFATWTCSDALLPEFLLYCLRAMRRDLLERLAQGSTHQTIYMPAIESIMVPLPPIAEQHEAVAEIQRQLAHVDRLRDALGAQLPKLAEYRTALITEAVAGPVEVGAG